MTKGLLNPNEKRSRSRSRTRGMQGRQLGKIKASDVASKSASSRVSSGSKLSSPSAPIIDMSSLRRSVSKGRTAQHRGGNETTFTKTTVGSSDSDRDRGGARRRSRSKSAARPRSVSRARKLDENKQSGAVGRSRDNGPSVPSGSRRAAKRAGAGAGAPTSADALSADYPNRSLSRGRRKGIKAEDTDNNNSSNNNRMGTIIPFRRPNLTKRKDRQLDNSIRSSTSTDEVSTSYNNNQRKQSSPRMDSSILSTSSNNTGKLSQPKEGAIVPFQQQPSSSASLPASVYSEEQVRKCPHHPSVVLEEKIYERWLVLHSECPKCVQEREDDIGATKNSRRKSIGRGFMKFGRKNKNDYPQRSSSALSDSPKRSMSPFSRFRRSRNRRNSRTGDTGDGDNSATSSANSMGSRRSLSRGSSRCSRSPSPPPFRRSNNSISGNNSPSCSKDNNAGAHNTSIGHLNNSENAIVLRERTPSPDNNSVELNPDRVRPSSPGSVDSFGRRKSPDSMAPRGNRGQHRQKMRGESSSSPNSLGRRRGNRRPSLGPRCRGIDSSSRSTSMNSMGRPISRPRVGTSWSRSPSPRSNRRGSMGRPTSRQRPPNQNNRMSRGRGHSRSPSLQRGRISRGRGNSRPSSPNSMGGPRRGSSWSRSPSPRPNQRRGSMGRPLSRQRPPSQRRMSRRRSSRSSSPNSIHGPPGRQRPPSQRRMSRGRCSRSSSPNSIDGPPSRRTADQGRMIPRGRGNRPSSPQNSMGRRMPHHPRAARRGSQSPYNSRIGSSYNSIGSHSRSPSPFGRYDSAPRHPRSSAGSKSSSGSQSMESSNADYFDDEHGEVVLHLKGNSSRRPSVVNRRIESLDDSFSSFPRRRNSFDESFDRLTDRAPLHRRANSFDESFERMLPPEHQPHYGKINSLDDSYDGFPPDSKSAYRPYDDIASNDSSYRGNSSFDRMRQRIAGSRHDGSFTPQDDPIDRIAKPHLRHSLGSDHASSQSTGMEWSDFSNVKSKSKNLSVILRDIKNPSRGADRGAPSPRRNTVALDRSLSPLPPIANRSLSTQSRLEDNRKRRSSSVGPGARGNARNNEGSQLPGKTRSQVDLSNIMRALTTIRASNMHSDRNAQMSVNDHASKSSSSRHVSGPIRANKSMQEIETFPRVESENSFTAPERQPPHHRHSSTQMYDDRDQLQQHRSEVNQLHDNQQRFSARDRHENTPHRMQRNPSMPPEEQVHMIPECVPPRVCSPSQPPPPPPRHSIRSPENLPQQQGFSQMNQDSPPENDDWKRYQLNTPQMIEQPPTQNDEWRKYQQPSGQMQPPLNDDSDWRKYQVGAQKGPSKQRNPHDSTVEETGRSQSAGRGGPDWGNTEKTQQGNPDWMTYQVGTAKSDKGERSGGRSVSSGRKGKSKMFGRAPDKHTVEDRQANKTVKKMPFTDQFGDFGLYTGQVDDESRPHGKGSMKYDNGVFYEGTWTNGCQDQKAASQYGRIRGGFTSWQGQGKHATKGGTVMPWNARKTDSYDPNAKTNVRGMEWTDLNGDSGRYTGEINADRLPHGFGVMKYDFGLIAEGDWNNGILKEGPQDRLIGAAASMMSGARSVGGGMSIGPGMSVGPGAQGFNPASVGPMSIGAGMSVGGSALGGSFMGGGMPMMFPPQGIQIGGMNPMMMNRGMPLNPQQHMLIAQQNAAMKSMGGSVYGGGSVVYGGPPPMHMPPMPMHQGMPPPMMQQMPPMPMQMSEAPPVENRDVPPITEIKIPP